MDAIDITDSAFSLEMPGVNEVISVNGMKDYTMFIYIGAAIVVVFISMFIYKFYMNKATLNQMDCSGGFCTMSNNTDCNVNYCETSNPNKQL